MENPGQRKLSQATPSGYRKARARPAAAVFAIAKRLLPYETLLRRNTKLGKKVA